MAFRPENLSALSYANGFTLWHYRTTEPATDVDATGYFNAAHNLLRVGDFVLLNAGIGTVPVHGVLVVASNVGGTVDLTNLTPFGSVNSD